MKFSIGYNAGRNISMPELVKRYDCVSEVYFPWPELPSGRSPMDSDARERLFSDLRELAAQDIKLTLLLNAACWGENAFTKTLATKICKIISDALEIAPLGAVTVFSPMIADAVRKNFPAIKTRASVNLKLGSLSALTQCRDLFDEFTIQRELNYDLETLGQIRKWADGEGKTIHLLANSGCCVDCPVQNFHDCLVAHENSDGASEDRYANHILSGCWQYLGKKENNYRFLSGTWIRPEDAPRYAGITDTLKLATRGNPDPELVIRAYARGKFSGNLPDLLEPGHAALFAPVVVDNRSFPDDWFEQKTAVSKDFYKLDELCRSTWPLVTINTVTGSRGL